MPVHLLSLSNGPNIVVDKPILLLGRDLECDVRFDSRKISRKHCCVAQVGDFLVVRDLGSTNGVRINGSRVLEGRLKSGDELTVGNYRYQVSWATAVHAAARAGAKKEAANSGRRRAEVASPDEVVSAETPIPVLEEEMPDAAEAEDHPPQSPSAKAARPGKGPPYPVLPDELDLAPPSDTTQETPPPE
jgi:pSer/pThr/pTyr-binding forkhead associated (FHA) protein